MTDMIKLIEENRPSTAAKKIKSVGYFFWGFMSDLRMKNGKPFSSPDGSLLHAFSIVYELQQRGIDVYRLGIDRDEEYVFSHDNFRNAFQSFSQEKRYSAYVNMLPTFHNLKYQMFDWPDVDVVLCEWRMPTRYNQLPQNHPDFEPDLLLQHSMIQHYRQKGTPIICLDLDYMMTEQDDKLFHFVLEPGFKRGHNHHIDVPFILEDINQFVREKPKNQIVYIGNRYLRDDQFDLFLGKQPKDFIEIHVYGNWLEGDKDSKERWPHIHFHERIQPFEMHDAYKHAITTPLLLKDEYNKYGFMSIRLIESLLWGTIPVLPTSFQSPIEYNLWRVRDQDDLLHLATSSLFKDPELRELSRQNALQSIKQHDVKYFVNKLLSVV